jgi:hypothetical protein
VRQGGRRAARSSGFGHLLHRAQRLLGLPAVEQGVAQNPFGETSGPLIELIGEGDRAVGERDRGIEVATHPSPVGGDTEHDRCCGRALESGHLHRGLTPGGDLVAHSPERVLPKRTHQSGRDGEVASGHGACVSGAEVVEVAVDRGRPSPLVGAVQPDGSALGHIEEPAPVALLDRRQRAGILQPLVAELAQGLQQAVPRLLWVDHVDHRLVDQVDDDTSGPLASAERRPAHDFGGVKVEAAGERRKLGERVLIDCIEQLVGPLDEPMEAAMPRLHAGPLPSE